MKLVRVNGEFQLTKFELAKYPVVTDWKTRVKTKANWIEFELS